MTNPKGGSAKHCVSASPAGGRRIVDARGLMEDLLEPVSRKVDQGFNRYDDSVVHTRVQVERAADHIFAEGSRAGEDLLTQAASKFGAERKALVRDVENLERRVFGRIVAISMAAAAVYIAMVIEPLEPDVSLSALVERAWLSMGTLGLILWLVQRESRIRRELREVWGSFLLLVGLSSLVAAAAFVVHLL